MQSGRTYFFLLGLLASRAAAQNFNLSDFSFYPANAQQCVLDAANGSKCSGSSVPEQNACLCGNGGNFVLGTAACVGKSDPGDLVAVYNTMSSACSNSNTPITLTQQAFLDAGNAAASSSAASSSAASSTNSVNRAISTSGRSTTFSTSTKSSGSSTTSSSSASMAVTTMPNGQTVTVTATPTVGSSAADSTNNNNNSNKSSSGGISSGAQTGIIAGASVAGVAILAAVVLILLRYRRGRKQAGGPAVARDENHPMLNAEKFGGSGTALDAGSKWRPNSTLSSAVPSSAMPTPTSSQQGWGYSPAAPYFAQQPQPSPQQPAVFELPGAEPPEPVEMPASPLQRPDPAQRFARYSTRYD